MTEVKYTVTSLYSARKCSGHNSLPHLRKSNFKICVQRHANALSFWPTSLSEQLCLGCRCSSVISWTLFPWILIVCGCAQYVRSLPFEYSTKCIHYVKKRLSLLFWHNLLTFVGNKWQKFLTKQCIVSPVADVRVQNTLQPFGFGCCSSRSSVLGGKVP